MNIDKKYIVDGIDIRKTKEGYRVFTIPTQHFHITNLDELTNERIEHEIRREEKYNEGVSEMFREKFQVDFNEIDLESYLNKHIPS